MRRSRSDGEARNRTGDTTIFSRVLYQLSYLAVQRAMVPATATRASWRRIASLLSLRRGALVVLALCLTAGALAMAADESAEAATADCRGLKATVTGSDGPDRIVGKPGRDVIQANGGNDTVDGGGGGDLICGGQGDDVLRGGASFDALHGDEGNDTLFGGAEDDVLFGGPGDDPTLDGGSGFDIAYGDEGGNRCTENERNYRCEIVTVGTDEALPAEADPQTVPCDYLAAPTGDDGDDGSVSRPYRTVERLVNTLQPGETGCLAPGAVFTEPDQEINVRAQGRAGRPVVLRTTPGGPQATIRGRLWFCADTPLVACTDDASGSHDVEFRDLVLDGSNSLAPFQGVGGPPALPSPTVNGDRITFTHVNVTNRNSGPCFAIGSINGYGIAANTVIRRRSRIHNCGRPGMLDLPISLEGSRDARIEDSLIYDNPDIGIYIYADAQGSIIRRNVIDGNGRAVRFDPGGSFHPEGTRVTENVISNSRLSYGSDLDHWQVEGGFSGSPRWTNLVTDNCLFQASGRNFQPGQTAFTESSNTIVTGGPGYLDRVAFRLRGGPGECPTRFGPREEAPPAVEPPKAARFVNVRPKGKGRRNRFVRIKRSRIVTRAGRRFLPLIARARIPVGSTVDATRRPVKLTISFAPGRASGRDRTLTISRGSFIVRQFRTARPITELALTGAYVRRGRRSFRSATGRRKLSFNGHCRRCRVRGGWGVASRPRSRFLIEDRVNGTFLAVFSGRVRFRDCVRRRTVMVRAGERYLARRGRRRC